MLGFICFLGQGEDPAAHGLRVLFSSPMANVASWPHGTDLLTFQGLALCNKLRKLGCLTERNMFPL